MKHVNISPLQKITATGGGVDVNVRDYNRQGVLVFSSKNDAGTSPTHDRKLQGSAALTRGYEYSTVGTTANELREGATTNVKLGLKFTQSGARSVKRVALYLDKQGSIAAGKKLTLTLETDNSGNPSGTVVTNGTAATVDIDTEVSATAGWVVFTFAKPVDLADATVYHFVLAGDYTESGTVNVRWYSKTVGSGGTFNTYNATSWAGVTTTESLMAYADQYTFSDITGLTQTQATGTVVVDESKEAWLDYVAEVVRVYDTIGGSSSPAFYAACDLVADGYDGA